MPQLPKAKPIPRDYEIISTMHSLRRGIQRGVSEERVFETVRHGTAQAMGETGQRGGDIFKFRKTYVEGTGGNRTSKTAVAVAEISDNLCRIVSTYYA